MEARQVTLTIELSDWCAEAAALLAGTLKGTPCFGVADYEREVTGNPECALYRVADGARTVGYVVLRIENYEHGAEGVILAGAGELGGAALYAQVMPALEAMFSGIVSLRVDPCRRGAILQLLKLGYLPTHVTMRKAAPMPHPTRDQAELLEDLAIDDTIGGPDLRGSAHAIHAGARARRYKGGSSSSANQQVTTNVDRRLVVDGQSIGFAGDYATLNILDANAIKSAFDFAALSDQETGKTINSTLGLARDVFFTGVGVLEKAGEHVQAQTKLVATAYDQARGDATQKNLLTAAAIATVAIVAVRVWSK